eukprot:COSAG06_NODE_5578_length_3391_cov_1.563791_5_plen_435_part_00
MRVEPAASRTAEQQQRPSTGIDGWQRHEQPVLSALTALIARQGWCSVELYSPSVVYHDGRFKMWFLGSHDRTRSGTMNLGYAESETGVSGWVPHPTNPILTAEDLPEQITGWNTPHVLWDEEEGQFRMFFCGLEHDDSSDEAARLAPVTGVRVRQSLGTATSRDGLRWEVQQEVLRYCVRSPCVLKEGPRCYVMWANADGDPPPDGWLPTIPGSARHDLGESIYRFASADGLQWERDTAPALTSEEAGQRSIVCKPQRHSMSPSRYSSYRLPTRVLNDPFANSQILLSREMGAATGCGSAATARPRRRAHRSTHRVTSRSSPRAPRTAGDGRATRAPHRPSPRVATWICSTAGSCRRHGSSRRAGSRCCSTPRGTAGRCTARATARYGRIARGSTGTLASRCARPPRCEVRFPCGSRLPMPARVRVGFAGVCGW